MININNVEQNSISFYRRFNETAFAKKIVKYLVEPIEGVKGSLFQRFKNNLLLSLNICICIE